VSHIPGVPSALFGPEDADAAVVVWDRIAPAVGDLIGRVVRKGVPYRVLVASDTR
jgi:hypothetical protein